MPNILIAAAIKVQRNWPANFVEEDLPEFNDQRNYSTYDSWLKEYKNVWISPDSVVYKNGLLLKETLPAKQYETYYRYKHIIKKIIKGRKISLDSNKKYLLVTDLWSSGHFHWFADILPKLIVIADRTSEYVLLLQDTHYLRTIGLESIECLKLKFSDIIFMNEENFYKARNLTFVSKLGESGHCQPAIMEKLRHQFVPNFPEAKKRIYVSRSGAQYRKILNEAGLINLLGEYNFETIHAEDMSLERQIEIFSSARTLISIHGAGLTNCVFMQPGSQVVEIRKKENGSNNVGYWHFSDSLRHQYYYYNGEPDSSLPLVGRGCNITVPLQDFEKKILQLVK